VHVTLRARIAPLRSQFLFPTIRLALLRAARRDPDRFRIVHFAVQRDHVHLIVEARDAKCLSSGVRGLAVRIARYANDLLNRRGCFWADRWHGRALRSPREVRNVILYVLANFRKHALRAFKAGIDPFSSGLWFDGWREWSPAAGVPPPLAGPAPWLGHDAVLAASLRPRTWLAAHGWRRHARLSIDEQPRSERRR
jgi:REP element-mobilizing transposase RayT